MMCQYLYYQLTVARHDIASLGQGSTFTEISRGTLASYRVVSPPLNEQASIVKFLDRETARIDALVERKQNLVDLLEQQRTALISRSVTRGLAADVAMQDTGVEWLGEIPAHWEAMRLKHWVTVNDVVLSETTDPQFEFRYLEITDVRTGTLAEEPKLVRFGTAPSRARRIVRTGDTILSTVRTYLRAAWFADDVADDPLVCSTGFAVLTPRPGVVPKFLGYLAQSEFFTDRVAAESSGTAYPAIAESRLGAFHVPVPPALEQHTIADFLDRESAKIDALVAKVQEAIDSLKEYRVALIFAAVKGNIDVRGEATQ